MIEATPESWVIITRLQFSFNHLTNRLSGEQAALPDHLHAPLGGRLACHLHRVDFRCSHTLGQGLPGQWQVPQLVTVASRNTRMKYSLLSK